MKSIFVGLVVLVSLAKAQVDFNSFVETCVPTTLSHDQHYVEGWERKSTNGIWTLQLANKFGIYLLAQDVYRTNNFQKFDEKDFKKGCFTYTTLDGWNQTEFWGYGKDQIYGKMFKTNVPYIYRFSLSDGVTGGTSGVASVSLTDNESFEVFEACWENGLRGFYVWALRDLKDVEREAIKLHLESIGFNKYDFVDLKPRQECVSSGKNGRLVPKDNSDLPIPAPDTPYAPGNHWDHPTNDEYYRPKFALYGKKKFAAYFDKKN